MSDSSSERIKQLKAFASYVFLILAGAYWSLRLNTDAGPIGAAFHAPFFYLMAYRHRHEFEERMGAMERVE